MTVRFGYQSIKGRLEDSSTAGDKLENLGEEGAYSLQIRTWVERVVVVAVLSLLTLSLVAKAIYSGMKI
jgi:hypothetical protein